MPGDPSDDASEVDSLVRQVAAISEWAPPIRLAGGDVLSERFVIEHLADSGGMGAVYRAVDRESGAPVAVKVMAGHRVRDSARFAREAFVLAELSHPAIVRYVAHGTFQETPFLVMEWLDGEDLSERLARAAGPLGLEESLALIRRACEGIAAAHARGVVHRDIKPSNLFLCGKDPASTKLVDFGVAQLRVGTVALTRSGTIIGTMGYMAPEQAMGQRDVDSRADIFALGCVLYECLVGQPAFAGKQAAVAIAKVLQSEPRPACEVQPHLPRELGDLVRIMIAKDRRDRPQDAAAILRALDAVPAAPKGD